MSARAVVTLDNGLRLLPCDSPTEAVLEHKTAFAVKLEEHARRILPPDALPQVKTFIHPPRIYVRYTTMRPFKVEWWMVPDSNEETE